MKVFVLSSDEQLVDYAQRSFENELPSYLVAFEAPYPMTSKIVGDVVASGSEIALLGPDVPEDLVLSIARSLRASHPEIDCLAFRSSKPVFLAKAFRNGLRDLIDPDEGFAPLGTALLALSEASELRRYNLLAGTPIASHGELITIIGPKGGVGKTTVAINLAYNLAQVTPNEVVLVDFDLIAGGVADGLQIESENSVATVAADRMYEDPTALKLSLTAMANGMHVLPAPTSLARADELTAQQLEGTLRALTELFRFVIVDTGPGSTDAAVIAAIAAKQLLIVTSPEVGGLRALARHLDGFAATGAVTAKQIVLLNRADSRTGVSVEDVETRLRRPVDFDLPIDRHFAVAGNYGVPYLETRPKTPAAEVFDAIGARFGGARTEEPVRSKKWFRP